MSLASGEASDELKQIEEIQTKYREINLQYSKLLDIIEDKEKMKDVEAFKGNTLKLERMRLPTFHSDLKGYTRFKADFKKFVLPEIDIEKAAYVLRSCLGEEPSNYVRNVDDSIEDMWERLDEKFGQPSILAEVIKNEIRRYHVLEDADDARLVEFIEMVESNYRDLVLMGMQNEISNLRTVSLIEEKLPGIVRRKWAEEVSKDGSVVDKRNPFPPLLKFLIQQRKAIEYMSSGLRSSFLPTSKYMRGNVEADSQHFTRSGGLLDSQVGRSPRRCMQCIFPEIRGRSRILS